MKEGQIILTAEDGSEEAFFVLEEAKIAGETYLLVTEGMEDGADALILKQIVESSTRTYEVLHDEREIKILTKYFEELLEDVELYETT